MRQRFCDVRWPPPLTADEAARARARTLVGQMISERYRVEELLAMGGMGAVYRGTHMLLKKRIAIKLLHPGTEELPEGLARFEREAIAGAHIQHPNVAAATDFGKLEDGSYFLILEYVRGVTLNDAIKAGPFPAARAARVARQIAAALGAVHALGIVHRDLKPSNVMLAKEDHAKLIDFGLAKVKLDRISMDPRRSRLDSLVDSKPRITGVGVIFGTIAYLAPEAALGMEAVDARSDLYALGIILYQMLSGRYPFDGGDSVELFRQHRTVIPEPIAIRAPGVTPHPGLEAIAMRLLEKDPAARFQTAEEVIAALDAAVPPEPPGDSTSGQLAPRAAVAASATEGSAIAPQTSPEVERRGRSSYLLPAIVTALALSAGAALVMLLGPGEPTLEPPWSAPAAGAPAASIASVASIASISPGSSVAPVSSAIPARSVSVAPSATAPPAADGGAIDPRDSLALKLLLVRTVRVRDWGGGEGAFLELSRRDSAVFREPEVAAAARDLASAVETERAGDRVFDALENRMGTDGLDLLYDLVSMRGQSRAALRAVEILRRKEVIARATPALRVAFELREARCVDKLALLDRATKEGDVRALLVMETLGTACFGKSHRQLDAAMTELRARVARR